MWRRWALRSKQLPTRCSLCRRNAQTRAVVRVSFSTSTGQDKTTENNASAADATSTIPAGIDAGADKTRENNSSAADATSTTPAGTDAGADKTTENNTSAADATSTTPAETDAGGAATTRDPPFISLPIPSWISSPVDLSTLKKSPFDPVIDTHPDIRDLFDPVLDDVDVPLMDPPTVREYYERLKAKQGGALSVPVPPPPDGWQNHSPQYIERRMGSMMDVFKHTVLLQMILAHQSCYADSWTYVDLHAGPVAYDLQRSIHRCWGVDTVYEYGRWWAKLARETHHTQKHSFIPLMRILRQLNGEKQVDPVTGKPTVSRLDRGFSLYPGNVMLVRSLMRERDRAILFEPDIEYRDGIIDYINTPIEEYSAHKYINDDVFGTDEPEDEDVDSALDEGDEAQAEDDEIPEDYKEEEGDEEVAEDEGPPINRNSRFNVYEYDPYSTTLGFDPITALCKPITSHALINIDLCTHDRYEAVQLKMKHIGSHVLPKLVKQFPHATIMSFFPLYGACVPHNYVREFVKTGVRDVLYGSFTAQRDVEERRPYHMYRPITVWTPPSHVPIPMDEPWGIGVVILKPPGGFDCILQKVQDDIEQVWQSIGYVKAVDVDEEWRAEEVIDRSQEEQDPDGDDYVVFRRVLGDRQRVDPRVNRNADASTGWWTLESDIRMEMSASHEHPQFAWLTPRYWDHVDVYQNVDLSRKMRGTKKKEDPASELARIERQIQASDPRLRHTVAQGMQDPRYYNERRLDAQLKDIPQRLRQWTQTNKTRTQDKDNDLKTEEPTAAVTVPAQRYRQTPTPSKASPVVDPVAVQHSERRASVIQQNEIKLMEAWNAELQKRKQSKQQQQATTTKAQQ